MDPRNDSFQQRYCWGNVLFHLFGERIHMVDFGHFFNGRKLLQLPVSFPVPNSLRVSSLLGKDLLPFGTKFCFLIADFYWQSKQMYFWHSCFPCKCIQSTSYRNYFYCRRKFRSEMYRILCYINCRLENHCGPLR